MAGERVDARGDWFLQWRMRQAAAFILLGTVAAAHAMGKTEPACEPAPASANSGAPSIVILIDHSASMREADPAADRYRTAARLLERVHETSPGAEAAVIVFSDILHFDWRDDAYLQPAFPGNPGMQFESYVPFTRLDKSFADGRTGLDTLRAFLRCGTSRPDHATERRTGYLSDFPLAFEAARAAFRQSASLPSRRMLVVVTDGEAPAASAFGGDSARARFHRGADLPATYALFVHGDSATDAPQGLRELVANIGGNGYSAANPRSTSASVPARACGRAMPIEERILADIADPVPEPAAVPVAADLSVCKVPILSGPALRPGNSLARIRVEGEVDSKHWIVAGLPASPPGSRDWSCCRFDPNGPAVGDSDRYIHVSVESDRPFEVAAKVFSHLGEPIAHAGFRIDGHAFSALPPSPGGRRLDLYWDGRGDGGRTAATGAYALTLQASDNAGPGLPARKSAGLARRIGILRTR